MSIRKQRFCESGGELRTTKDNMKKTTKDIEIGTCDECGSKYYLNTSKMVNLCPECSFVLYGYENCNHNFENGRCLKCLWNGSVSNFIRNINEKDCR